MPSPLFLICSTPSSIFSVLTCSKILSLSISLPPSPSLLCIFIVYFPSKLVKGFYKLYNIFYILIFLCFYLHNYFLHSFFYRLLTYHCLSLPFHIFFFIKKVTIIIIF